MADSYECNLIWLYSTKQCIRITMASDYKKSLFAEGQPVSFTDGQNIKLATLKHLQHLSISKILYSL